MKLTIHDNVEMLRFQLEGALAGPGVLELEQCWRTASSTLGQRALQVDLRKVTHVDEAGRSLLLQMRAQGAKVVKTEEKPAARNWLVRLTRASLQTD